MAHRIQALGATTLVGALLGALLIGCAADRQDPEAPDGVPNYVVDEEGGAEAALVGRVAEIDGCFYVEDDGPERHLTVAMFPAREIGVTDDSEGFTFLGDDYADGDDITLSGSMTRAENYAVPESCDDEVQQWRVTPSTPAP